MTPNNPDSILSNLILKILLLKGIYYPIVSIRSQAHLMLSDIQPSY